MTDEQQIRAAALMAAIAMAQGQSRVSVLASARVFESYIRTGGRR